MYIIIKRAIVTNRWKWIRSYRWLSISGYYAFKPRTFSQQVLHLINAIATVFQMQFRLVIVERIAGSDQDQRILPLSTATSPDFNLPPAWTLSSKTFPRKIKISKSWNNKKAVCVQLRHPRLQELLTVSFAFLEIRKFLSFRWLLFVDML
jgi:hypothetical protein